MSKEVDVSIHFDAAAIERLAIEELRKRLAPVRCPVHGTGVTVDEVAPDGSPVLQEPCCDELTKAVRTALA